jgi:hypothetical protein
LGFWSKYLDDHKTIKPVIWFYGFDKPYLELRLFGPHGAAGSYRCSSIWLSGLPNRQALAYLAVWLSG